ncbi:TetR family transcriptional regulator [Dactylosporangium aurantiacum]|uniref:TetR family transcriptional regulator n=1 Tax=Dactylosporangium aurantiacum TaxID=35754 RepID=A0A9Q9MFA3_9ACTN|nr:TetR/AcrR family transcriptional regulator [Dactylosporangium aurantiacum]MDG6101821.1 helix-turn-helix domain containing protein [Dactylosporangium aurantiacum]UWZ52375.1 TetR family transcriptional regulator [Dactylosporangium aurantiacum]
MTAGQERRARRRAQKRREIKLAAVRLALERGPDALTVEAISAAADISVRSFFNYFSAKEETLAMDSSWTAEELLALLAARPADEPPVRSMRAIAKEIADSFAPAREELELWQRHPDLLAIGQPESEEDIFPALIAAVAERIGADPVRAVYPGLLVTTSFGVVHSAVRASWVEGAAPVEALIDEMFDLLERGL